MIFLLIGVLEFRSWGAEIENSAPQTLNDRELCTPNPILRILHCDAGSKFGWEKVRQKMTQTASLELCFRNDLGKKNPFNRGIWREIPAETPKRVRKSRSAE